MNPILLLAALSAGIAVFYLAFTLQTSMPSTRRAVRARTLDEWQASEMGAPAPRVRRSAIRQPLTAASEKWELELTQAAWPIKVSEFVLMRIVFGLVIGFLVFLFSESISSAFFLRLLLALLAGWFGFNLPGSYLRRRKKARMSEVEALLPETLAGMAEALKAGSGLLQALDNAAANTPPPLGPELKLTMRDLQLGGDPQAVFGDLIRRVPSHDLEIAATAIVVQRSVGGNLSEILEHVADTVRERHEIRAEVKVLTSTQRLTGLLTSLVPIGVAAFFFLVNPESARVLIDEPVGRIALAMGIGLEIAGIWLIGKLSVIEV